MVWQNVLAAVLMNYRSLCARTLFATWLALSRICFCDRSEAVRPTLAEAGPAVGRQACCQPCSECEGIWWFRLCCRAVTSVYLSEHSYGNVAAHRWRGDGPVLTGLFKRSYTSFLLRLISDSGPSHSRLSHYEFLTCLIFTVITYTHPLMSQCMCLTPV